MAALSIAQQQLVEIAKALSLNARRAHHGRADLQPDARRDGAGCTRSSRPARAGRGDHLHHAPARRSADHRRSRRRAARRRERRRARARRADARQHDPADGRTRHRRRARARRHALPGWAISLSTGCAHGAIRSIAVSFAVGRGEIRRHGRPGWRRPVRNRPGDLRHRPAEWRERAPRWTRHCRSTSPGTPFGTGSSWSPRIAGPPASSWTSRSARTCRFRRSADTRARARLRGAGAPGALRRSAGSCRSRRHRSM